MAKRIKYAMAYSINCLLEGLRFVKVIRPSIAPRSLNPGDKILFLCLEHLGDTIMATPAIEAFKTACPACQVAVLTRPQNWAVFFDNPYVDEVLTDETPWWSEHPVRASLRPGYWWAWRRTIAFLRKKNYEAIIDFRGDLRHLLVFGSAAKAKFLLGFGRTGGEALLSANIPYINDMHEVDKKLSLLKPLGINGFRPKPRIWLLPEEIKKARETIFDRRGDSRSPIILIDPGAKPIQQWPIEGFAYIARKLRQRFKLAVLISVGSRYHELGNTLVHKAGLEVVRPLGNLSLRELISIVACCDLVISADTGLAHIAAAVGTRAITLFGPTNPGRFWNGMEGSRAVVSPLSCCNPKLHENCEKAGHPIPGACMKAISPDMVERVLEEILDESIGWKNDFDGLRGKTHQSTV